MHALPRSQLERLEISKKRPHPASPMGSTSTPSYPNYWDAALPAPATSFLPTLPPISYLTRDAIVRMAYLTLSHLAGLCQVSLIPYAIFLYSLYKFVDGVDPECLQNSQLEIALGIVSRFTHNLDVARPTPNSPRNKVCPPYDQLPTTPRRKYQRTSSNPSLLRTSSKNNLLNSNNAVRTAPQINQPPTVNTTTTDQAYTNQTTVTYNQHNTTPYNNTAYVDNVYNNTYNAYNSPFSEAGASSLSPAPVKEERGGDVSSPPSEVFFAHAPTQGRMNQCNNQGGREASYPREEMEEASTSEILSEIMATWGVKDEKEPGSVGGSGTVKKGIRVKAAEGEITIMPFRMPSVTLQRTVTPPPIVFSQFYPPQTLSLDSFEIGATLGTGTYGIVKLCKQKSTQNFFALKIINKERIARLQQRRHIINEKKILMQLNHPFIVKLYTTFQDPVNIYFLMEFVPGGELFSHIRRNARGYLSNSAACFYAAEIVLAIRYLHFLKIAHRDLKPENILLDESGHAKIVDFGFAKKISEKAWTMCGTPHYIAPEVILGKGHTHAVDYWSLGIMIYEMLAGNPPFAGSNKLEVFKKIVSNEPIEMPDHFQPLAKDLIKRLLMTDYTHRLGYGGVEEVMRHPWFQNIDWDALYHCSMQPPVHLPLAGEGDTSFFPQYPIEGENLDYLFEESISDGSARPDNFWKGF